MNLIAQKEISEWGAYQELYGPIGPERDDLRAAQIAWMLARVLGGSDAELTDFMLRWEDPDPIPEDLTEEQRGAKVLELFNKMQGMRRG
jgi:hypothetical protein